MGNTERTNMAFRVHKTRDLGQSLEGNGGVAKVVRIPAAECVESRGVAQARTQLHTRVWSHLHSLLGLDRHRSQGSRVIVAQ